MINIFAMIEKVKFDIIQLKMNVSAQFKRDDEISHIQDDTIIAELSHLLATNPSNIKIIYIRSHNMSNLRKRIKALLVDQDCYVEEKSEENVRVAKYCILTHFNNIGSMVYESETIRQLKKKYPDFELNY